MITEMIEALQAGKQLENSAGWKNAQATANAIAAIIAAGVSGLSLFGVHLPITHEQIVTLGSAGAVLLGLFNSYTTAATSKSVGLPPKGPPDPEP